MDPTATLAEIGELCERISGARTIDDDTAALVERVQALDEWLRLGGFAPKQWRL